MRHHRRSSQFWRAYNSITPSDAIATGVPVDSRPSSSKQAPSSLSRLSKEAPCKSIFQPTPNCLVPNEEQSLEPLIVLVFERKKEDGEYREGRLRCRLAAILSSGLRLSLSRSRDGGLLYCRIGATMDRLSEEADRLQVSQRRNPIELLPEAIILLDGTVEVLEEQGTRLENVFERYTHATRDNFIGAGEFTFSTRAQIELVMQILESTGPRGAGLDLAGDITQGDISQIFCLHQKTGVPSQSSLLHDWSLCFNLRPIPIDHIRDYFGEQVAFYFAFLDFYKLSLILPALVGAPIFVYQIVVGTTDIAVLPFYSIFLALWASLMLEFWKRRRSRLAHRWGVMGHEQDDTQRPQFKGKLKRNPITGKPEKYFSPSSRARRYLAASVFILFLVGLVIAATLVIILWRVTINQYSYGYGASVINAIVILILDKIYRWIAIKLTMWENLPTDAQFEQNLILKMFGFQFVNSYFSLFWYAFSPGDSAETKMSNLSRQLGTLLIVRAFVGNLTEVGIPFVVRWLKRLIGRRKEGTLSGVEEQARFNTYTVLDQIDDYMELVIQFGFVTMFAIAFPAAAAVSLLSNFIEMHTDSYKLLSETQRPAPKRIPDIGVWYSIMELMSFIAVISNAAMMVWVSDQLSSFWGIDDPWWQLLIVVIAEHGVFTIKFIVAVAIPDVPSSVHTEIQLAHQWQRYNTSLRPPNYTVTVAQCASSPSLHQLPSPTVQPLSPHTTLSQAAAPPQTPTPTPSSDAAPSAPPPLDGPNTTDPNPTQSETQVAPKPSDSLVNGPDSPAQPGTAAPSLAPASLFALDKVTEEDPEIKLVWLRSGETC